jgi:hypothetical protein
MTFLGFVQQRGRQSRPVSRKSTTSRATRAAALALVGVKEKVRSNGVPYQQQLSQQRRFRDIEAHGSLGLATRSEGESRPGMGQQAIGVPRQEIDIISSEVRTCAKTQASNLVSRRLLDAAHALTDLSQYEIGVSKTILGDRKSKLVASNTWSRLVRAKTLMGSSSATSSSVQSTSTASARAISSARSKAVPAARSKAMSSARAKANSARSPRSISAVIPKKAGAPCLQAVSDTSLKSKSAAKSKSVPFGSSKAKTVVSSKTKSSARSKRSKVVTTTTSKSATSNGGSITVSGDETAQAMNGGSYAESSRNCQSNLMGWSSAGCDRSGMTAGGYMSGSCPPSFVFGQGPVMGSFFGGALYNNSAGYSNMSVPWCSANSGSFTGQCDPLYRNNSFDGNGLPFQGVGPVYRFGGSFENAGGAGYPPTGGVVEFGVNRMARSDVGLGGAGTGCHGSSSTFHQFSAQSSGSRANLIGMGGVRNIGHSRPSRVRPDLALESTSLRTVGSDFQDSDVPGRSYTSANGVWDRTVHSQTNIIRMSGMLSGGNLETDNTCSSIGNDMVFNNSDSSFARTVTAEDSREGIAGGIAGESNNPPPRIRNVTYPEYSSLVHESSATPAISRPSASAGNGNAAAAFCLGAGIGGNRNISAVPALLPSTAAMSYAVIASVNGADCTGPNIAAKRAGAAEASTVRSSISGALPVPVSPATVETGADHVPPAASQGVAGVVHGMARPAALSKSTTSRLKSMWSAQASNVRATPTSTSMSVAEATVQGTVTGSTLKDIWSAQASNVRAPPTSTSVSAVGAAVQNQSTVSTLKSILSAKAPNIRATPTSTSVSAVFTAVHKQSTVSTPKDAASVSATAPQAAPTMFERTSACPPKDVSATSSSYSNGCPAHAHLPISSPGVSSTSTAAVQNTNGAHTVAPAQSSSDAAHNAVTAHSLGLKGIAGRRRSIETGNKSRVGIDMSGFGGEQKSVRMSSEGFSTEASREPDSPRSNSSANGGSFGGDCSWMICS